MQRAGAQSELYFFRHGETVMNTKPHLLGGRSDDTQLTEKGVCQAERLGESLRMAGIFPDVVYSSPLVRAVDTASYSLARMGVDIEVTTDDALQELSHGIGEGKERREIFTEEVMRDIELLGKDFKLQGGESMNDVGKRMFDWVMRTVLGSGSDNNKSKRYFVYSHGGSIKYLASYILGWGAKQTYATPIDNVSVNHFTFKDGKCHVNYLNRKIINE